jgi:hypothetical protein
LGKLNTFAKQKCSRSVMQRGESAESERLVIFPERRARVKLLEIGKLGSNLLRLNRIGAESSAESILCRDISETVGTT